MTTKIAAALLVVLASCMANGHAAPPDREISLPQATIQAALASAAPQLGKHAGLLAISLQEVPRITLGSPPQRIGIAARVNICLFGRASVPVDITGTAGIRYDYTGKAFFLENPVADTVTSQSLPKILEPSARRAVNNLISSYFKTRPVYVLREHGMPQETTARRLLRSIRIEPGQLIATLAAA